MEFMVTETLLNCVGSGKAVAEALVAVKFSPKMLKRDPGAIGPTAKLALLTAAYVTLVPGVTLPTVNVTGTDTGLFGALGDVMVTWPLYEPSGSVAALAVTAIWAGVWPLDPLSESHG